MRVKIQIEIQDRCFKLSLEEVLRFPPSPSAFPTRGEEIMRRKSLPPGERKTKKRIKYPEKMKTSKVRKSGKERQFFIRYLIYVDYFRLGLLWLKEQPEESFFR
jgi:hypothetical protein